MSKVLITGASGFVGGFLVEACLKKGYEVTAGIRATSNRTYLQDKRIKFLELNFGDIDQLNRQLVGKHFDYIIHNAGVTKAISREVYFRVNTTYTKHFVEAIKKNIPGLEKFIYISSLAAYGPADDLADGIVTETTDPKPVTAYGESKLASEQFLSAEKDFPFIIIRPTAVYGPREKDIFTFFQMVKNGVEPYIGRKPQQLTFIYVRDLVRLVVDTLKKNEVRKSYFVSDGNLYQSQQLGQYIKKNLDKKTISFKVPLALVRVIALFNEMISKITGKYPPLNLEKVRELECLNWNCDIRPLKKDFQFVPEYDLEKGIKESIQWYKKNNWL